MRPRYDINRSYRWNYDHAPEAVKVDVPPVPGTWTFCGLPVPSPLGIAAGPLLNGRWCLYYASLGFDVVTYKTTRSRQRECYALPNLQPVSCAPLHGKEHCVEPCETMQGSWAVSFGMPSTAPDVWRRDVRWTRDQLPSEKRLNVSVVGTVQPGWSLEQLAEDYAICARWAVEAGADTVEINLSCPNVETCDGQLYQNPEDSRSVACCVSEAVGDVPLIIKVGHFTEAQQLHALLEAVSGHATAVAMTNSIATTVGASDQSPLFEGQRRGICGAAIREASVAQVAAASEYIGRHDLDLKLIGVGGIETADHVKAYLQAGAEACQLATAPMVDPEVALKIRRCWHGM